MFVCLVWIVYSCWWVCLSGLSRVPCGVCCLEFFRLGLVVCCVVCVVGYRRAYGLDNGVFLWYGV